ncbi:hypothetical protein ACFFKE_18205 [Streptomyces mutabilis]|uniref:hypothetical protein n=1 Tax=Streptomyces mutabilis TaxID=67332 RepID=UPI0035ECE303
MAGQLLGRRAAEPWRAPVTLRRVRADGTEVARLVLDVAVGVSEATRERIFAAARQLGLSNR